MYLPRSLGERKHVLDLVAKTAREDVKTLSPIESVNRHVQLSFIS